MRSKPPKPYRISGEGRIGLDIYTTQVGVGEGGVHYDNPILSYLNIVASLSVISSSSSFRHGGQKADDGQDLYIPIKTPGGVMLNVELGWRFQDTQTDVRYKPLDEGIPTGDGRQRVRVKRVRS